MMHGMVPISCFMKQFTIVFKTDKRFDITVLECALKKTCDIGADDFYLGNHTMQELHT